MIASAAKRFTKPAFHYGCNCMRLEVRLKTSVAAAYEKLKLHTEDCTLRDARNAFIVLAKKYHPDSGSSEANETKFVEYSEAYKIVVKSLKMKEAAEMPEILEEDEYSIEEILKETIPIAHRKYLTNDGIGFGTPSQRQKQYQAYRMNRASRMVSDYKIQKLQRETEGSKMLTVKEFAKRSKISHFVDRVVEDLVQESMAKGEFKDLKGGKIETPTMPYIDHHDYHLNRVLLNTGYLPEWVQSKQNIEKSLKTAKETLLKEKIRFHTPPHSKYSEPRWQEKKTEFKESIHVLNKDIQVFNLITPLPKTQMLLLREDEEFADVESMYEELDQEEIYDGNQPLEHEPNQKFSFVNSMKRFLGF